MMKHHEMLQHRSVWTIRKFKGQGLLSSEAVCRQHFIHEKGAYQPYEIATIEGNILLEVGITEIWNLTLGEPAVAYTEALSQIGVGSDSTAEAPTQDGLLDPAAIFVGMEAGFPILAGQTITFRGVFDGSLANYDWREFSVANGPPATTGVNMNRKVDIQGTKAAGQTWTLDLNITLS